MIDWECNKSSLEPLRGDAIEDLPKQCAHDLSPGMYVVTHPTWGLCRFEPSTKFQAQVWVDGDDARRAQVKWFCYECACVMPMGSVG